MLTAELKVTEGKHQGKSIPLNVKQFLVGREADCHLRPNSDLVSRHHCVFLVDDFTVRLRDLGSTNGTFVNGERIQGQVVLKPGDHVNVGKLAFELVILRPAPVAVPVGAPSHSEPAELPVAEAETSDNVLDAGDTEVIDDGGANKTVSLDGSTVFLPPPAAAAAPTQKRKASVEMPVRLPDPESTGASDVQIGSGGGADKQAPPTDGKPPAINPSMAAADIIKNRMRRPQKPS